MHVAMRGAFHKAEAKYNVTTEFPSLGLHSAAATGNVGLVEYALNNGQPINSVLDGVLPLHAACAGGNVQVVKVLIDHGADVNAPRLPRKYSLDKGRDTSAPIVGTSGSTPLHFAAANGNTDVVNLLLLHGAHANRADKHGVTPEMLANQNGWVECAKVLSDWILNKDRDLREREIPPRLDYQDMQSLSSPSPRRRLHVKQSIDTALNMLKTPDHSRQQHATTPPASPHKPFGEYTFYPSDQSNAPIDPGTRRPSLPHILQTPPTDSERLQKGSTSTTPPSNSRPKHRRPRSAGTGADRTPEPEVAYPVYGRGGSGRRLNSKYSLLNIFKKGQSGDLPEGADTPDSTSSAMQGSYVTLPLALTPSLSTHTGLSETAGTPSSLPTRIMHHRGSDASTKGRFIPQSQQSHTPNVPPLPGKPSGNMQTPPRSNVPLAVELHLALAQQHQRSKSNTQSTDGQGEDSEKPKASSPLAKLNAMLIPSYNRHRSGSSSSMPPALDSPAIHDEDVGSSLLATPDSESGKPSPSPRPGILRAHNRTNSSGQGSSPLTSRTLRFDSTSSNPSSERKGRDSPRSAPGMLRSYNSAGSLTKMNIQTNAESLESHSAATSEHSAETNRPEERDVAEGGDDDNEEYYGQPIHGVESSLGEGSDVPSVLLQRQRGNSFASSSESSLSPILSNENVNDPAMAVLNADFPFSIHRPPSLSNEEQEIKQPPSSSPGHLNVPLSSDTRGRGDSMSSNSTSDSRGSNLLMSSGTTSGSGASVTVVTPSMNALTLSPGSIKSLDTYRSRELPPIDFEENFSAPVTSNLAALRKTERRGAAARAPLDIDITSISSHAQVEALVQRARQDVLDVVNNSQELSPLSTGAGRTPLSAQLAAYGEILALEKKLRSQRDSAGEDSAKDSAQEVSTMSSTNSAKSLPGQFLAPAPPPRMLRQKSKEGVERQLSLEGKADTPRSRKRAKDPRRPSTADGLYSTRKDAFFTERTVSHQSSHSASTSNYPPTPSDDDIRSSSDLQDSYAPASHQPNSDTSLLTLEYTQPNPRARSPLHLTEESLSRMNSSDDADTETDTAPTMHRGTTLPLATVRNQRTEQIRSAKKLTKMGIPIADQAAATASRTAPSTPPSGSSKRFGIRSLMQTFKGKA